MHETIVEVRLDGREELRELWTKDISSGGLFVATAEPPPVGTKVQVAIRIPNAGKLWLAALVVHVVDSAQARARACDAGAGLHLVDMTSEQRKALQAYVDGIAARFSAETGDVATTSVIGDALPEQVDAATAIKEAGRFLDAIHSDDLYAALGVDSRASREEIDRRARAINARFTQAHTRANAPQKARLEIAKTQLEKVRRMLSDEERRVDYDFRHGNVRAEERIEAARKGGVGVPRLRELWTLVFPKRTEQAASRAADAARLDAARNFLHAATIGKTALELDPFNQTLRDTVREWEAKASKRG